MNDNWLSVLGADDLIDVESTGLVLNVLLQLQLAANQSPLFLLGPGHGFTQPGYYRNKYSSVFLNDYTYTRDTYKRMVMENGRCPYLVM